MNILLLGTTGRTGQYVMTEALAKGYSVVALTRRSNSISAKERVTVVVGDPRDEKCIVTALNGVDVVISCLGQRSSNDATLLTDSTFAVLNALRKHPDVPYLVLSQGLLFPSKNPLIALLRFFLQRYVQDSKGMEQLLRGSHARWEIVRPPRLKDTSGRCGYVIAVGHRPRGPSAMERYDLACYLVQEAEERSHLQEIVGITSGKEKPI